jgi:hypothetical protein
MERVSRIETDRQVGNGALHLVGHSRHSRIIREGVDDLIEGLEVGSEFKR